MHDPVSKDLIAKLETYTGCRERDLVGCRRYVRQLSRDLPTFESIWLDALVQARKLTPFQADRLTSGQEESLLIGEYQLVSQVMQDRVHRRYLGRHATTGQTVFIEQHACPAWRSEEVLAELRRVEQTISRLPAAFHVPSTLAVSARNDHLFAVYPYERGLTVRELLVRRGRFPEELVRVFTSQLVASLTALHELGIGHGDLRANNVLVNRAGSLVLLNAGLRYALTPQWTVQSELPFESYDTFAPEIVRSGQWSQSADFYAAGCLLWQMACGRPPLHSADSLLKLKVHLTREIPDVREYAPDVDPGTAEVIRRLTRRNPAERRLSPEDFAGERRSRLAIRQRVKSFAGRLESTAPIPTRSRNLPTVPGKLVAGIAIAAGLGLAGYGIGVNWPTTETPVAEEATPEVNSEQVATVDSPEVEAVPASVTTGPQEIPTPDANGRVVLKSGTRYVASDLIIRGPLTISTSGDEAAIVDVTETAWRIWADQVQLKNVAIVVASSQTQSAPTLPPALVVCQSRTFSAENCHWMPLDGATAEQTTRCVAWKPAGEAAAATELSLTNCTFHPAGSGLMLGGLADSISLRNCLKTSSGDMLEVSQSAFAERPLQLTCEHVTLRDADSLLNIHFPGSLPEPEIICRIQATNTVLAFAEQGSLLRLTGTTNPAASILDLDVAGQILLIAPGRTVAVWMNPQTGVRETVRVRGQIEGVLAQPITFRSHSSTAPVDSELQDYRGPRWNSVAPGIQAASLPDVPKTVIR